MKTISIKTGLAAALAASAMPAAPVSAAEGDSIAVRYADLDLSTADGVEELDRRIDQAARDVCGYGEFELGSRIPSRELRQCYRDAKRQLDRQFAQIVEEAQRAS